MRAFSLLGWVAIALLDLWAGVDVLTASDTGDTSRIVDQFGTDRVVDTRYVSQPDLIALIVGLLVLAAAVGLFVLRRDAARSTVGRLLVALALISVVALALGGHFYALLVPLCLAVGGAGRLTLRVKTPIQRAQPARRPRPTPASRARRPSPGPST